MNITYRNPKPDELTAFSISDGRAYSERRSSGMMDRYRQVFEFDRTISAFDGDQPVGGTTAFSLEMAVPGGTLPTAAVSWVSVQPTHRRRGILTELMRRQLKEIHEHGEALAVLHAAESIIYGRFGYGMTAPAERWEIDPIHTPFAVPLPAKGAVRFVDQDEAMRLFPQVYDRVYSIRPGMLNRDERWWDLRFYEREPPQPTWLYVMHETDGQPDGYVIYKADQNYEHGVPHSIMRIIEFVTATDDAYAALWRYCFDVDLISLVTAWPRPIDDPLPWMLADPRRLRRQQFDGLWLRVVDITAALSGRRYTHHGRLVLQVSDPFCPWNDGNYILDGGPDGATCRATNEPAGITLSAADLGAIYLGSVSPLTLSHAKRITELVPGKLAIADAMFNWPIKAWSPAPEPII